MNTIRWTAIVTAIAICTSSVTAQTDPPAGHDITKVDPVSPGAAIATPIPGHHDKRLRKYDMPELAGSRQALGSQLIDGRLPQPFVDYRIDNSNVIQRISFFEGGLVVVAMSGAGGTIRKKILIPKDAEELYLRNTSAKALATIKQAELPSPHPMRRAVLRIYDGDGYVERAFDPIAVPPKPLHDVTAPLQDLLRLLSEDREVSNTVRGYEPKVGDELVSDDQKTYRVERLFQDGDVVELRCTTNPTTIYVSKKDLFQYFVGARGANP